MEQFNADVSRVEKLDNDLNKAISERNKLTSNKQPTGRVDYQLKGGVESLKNELRPLEKLLYQY